MTQIYGGPLHGPVLHRMPQKPKFGATRQFNQPSTIQESRFENHRIPISTKSLVPSLIEKLDEIMTVTGEFYSKNEAFTTLLDMKVDPAQANALQSGYRDEAPVRMDAQVVQTLNVGKQNNVGIMVLASSAQTQEGNVVGRALSTFNAIDPASVHQIDPATGKAKLAPKPVTPLNIAPHEQHLNQQADNWNKNLNGFYRKVATRLAAKDDNALMEDLKNTSSESNRIVNSNVYVNTRMLNKKHTGHGGITAGIALGDMETLTKKYSNSQGFQFTDVSANYLDMYKESDALQFDTTLDHVDGNQVYLSSRIYKLDTKQQKASGPVILVHARMQQTDSQAAPLAPLDPSKLSAEAKQRQQEAIEWAKLHP